MGAIVAHFSLFGITVALFFGAEIALLRMIQSMSLSGGQQQRTFLARALVQDADARTERAIVEILRRTYGGRVEVFSSGRTK